MNNRSRVRERQWVRDMVSKEWGLRVGERERETVKGLVRIRLWLAHNNCGEKASLLNEAAAPPRPHTPTPTNGPPSHAPSFRGCLGLKKNFLALSTDGRPSRRRTLYPSFAWFLSLSLFLSLPFEHAFLFGKEAKGRQRRRRRRLRKSVFYGSVWWWKLWRFVLLLLLLLLPLLMV